MSKRWLGLLLLGVWIGGSGVAHATVTEAPDPIDVGQVVVGTSKTADGMLSDTATSTVTLQLATGGDCAQFQIVSATSLTIGTTPSTVTVKLTPTSNGAKNCTITVTGGTTAKTFGVMGTGTVPQISVNPAALAFANIDVGTTSATQRVTATNTGTGSLTITSATFSAGGGNYTVSGITGSQVVLSGDNVHWDIACKPPVKGPANGTFQILSNSATGNPASVDLTCSGDLGAIATDQTSLDFGQVLLNANQTQTVTLTNPGNVPVTGLSAVFDKPTNGYSIDASTPLPATLNTTDVVPVKVKFAPVKPTDGGAVKLTFKGNWGAGSTANTDVALTGQAVTITAAPASLPFGNFVFDSGPTLPFQITNLDSGTVVINTVTFVPDDIVTLNTDIIVSAVRLGGTVVPLPATIPGLGHLDVTVMATPGNRAGLVTGHFLVHSSTQGVLDQSVAVTGNATSTMFSATPLVNFGGVDRRGAAPPMQTAAIMNTGGEILTISSITKVTGAPGSGGGAFTVSLPTTEIQIMPGLAFSLTINYTPTAERTAGDPDTLVLSAQLKGVLGQTKAMITLQGHGTDRHMVVDPAPTFPPTLRNPGNTAPFRTLTVHNSGEALLKILTLTITGGPVWQLMNADPVDIPGGASHDFNLTFSPVDLGPAPVGQLTLTSNDVLNPTKVVMLTGTGVKRDVAFAPDAPDAGIDLGFTGVGIPITAENILAVINQDPSDAFTIHAIQLSGDSAFRLTDSPVDAALPAGATANFGITFTPIAVGDFTTTATLLLDQDPAGQATVKITGHAVFVDAHGSGGCDAGGIGRGGGLVIGLAALGALRRRRRRSRSGIAAAAVVATVAALGLGPAARADGVDIAVFEPTPATTGTGFQLQSPEVGADGSWTISSIASYASNPLVLDAVGADGTITNIDALIQRSSSLQLGAAYAFLDRFEVGAHLPLYMQSGQALADPKVAFTQPPASGNAIGNLTLHGKARLWHGVVGPGVFAVGAGAGAVIPMATKGQFTGSDKPEGRLLVLGSFTPAALESRLAISTNIGAVVRGKTQYANIAQKSGIAWGFGASYRVLDDLYATAEVFGEATPSGHTDAMSGTQVLSPIEWLAGVNFKADRRFTLGLAAGRGVTSAIGTPRLRGVLSLAFVAGAADSVPLHALARTGPDGDRDGDGIPDSVDKCPDEPEDFDMFEDTDGCPDPDNDHDGIPDALDKCPLDPEDKDGFQDADGCPDLDNDGDGIPDSIDKCPNEPEDKDGFEDLDGCPDPDNDHDGIPDEKDKCPNEPETINGVQDEDGCPDKGDSTIVLSPDRIGTIDPIQFTGLKLTRASLPLIEQVGATLRAHPEIVRLRITVHVQPTNDSDADQARSDKRAQAFRDWLVQFGIAPTRLEPRGFGGTKPLISPDQRGAAKINDRIELIILERK